MTTIHKILTTTALCLAAGGCVSCVPEHEYINKQVGGAEIPAGWDFTAKKQWVVRHDFPDGGRLRKNVIDFSELPEFSPYCGKKVQFFSPLAIQRIDYEGGTGYELQDCKPLPDGVSDLYHVPVQTGKLLAVRCLWEEMIKPGDKIFKLDSLSVEALLEVQHPDAQVNNGKPLYLYTFLPTTKPRRTASAPRGKKRQPQNPLTHWNC